MQNEFFERRANRANRVVDIVRKAGGSLDGRVKLQKITYLLRETGFDPDTYFEYEYRHYGPYSEDLAKAAEDARLFCGLREEQRYTPWGASYFHYALAECSCPALDPGEDKELLLIQMANKAPSVILELAATALFLYKENAARDPWEETKKRKPDKAENGRLQQARSFYESLRDRFEALPPLPSAC